MVGIDNHKVVENLIDSACRLPDPGLQQQIAASLEADAGLQETLERIALPVQAVDDVGAYMMTVNNMFLGEKEYDDIPGLTRGAFSM